MLFHDKLESVSPCANYFLTLKWSLKSRFGKKKNWLFLRTNDFSSTIRKWLFSGKQWMWFFCELKWVSIWKKIHYKQKVVFLEKKCGLQPRILFSLHDDTLNDSHFEFKSWTIKKYFTYHHKKVDFFLQFQLARHFI